MQYANGARVEAGYDLNGNAVRETDAMGNETVYAYDAADRLIAVTDALGNTTRYEYDLRDNISAVTDALGHTVRYAYDAAGRLLSETDALGNVTAYEYTKEGYLSRITKPDGGTVSYTYDKNGELTEEKYSDGRVVGYEYNELGRLTVTEGAEGRTEYQYDGRGYLVSILYPNGEKVGYEYDDRGSRTALVYPDGNKVGYGYDALGRMTSVTGLDGSVTRYEYDALGRRTLTAGGNLTTEYEYDEVGSVVRMATSGDTNEELLYGYNLNGMLTRETRRENGADTVSEYAYDALNRIASFSNGSVTEAYSYDAAGNMLEKIASGTAITMTYDAANRMTGMESVNGSIAYTYSASGDLITKTMGELRDSYTYDAAGNLTQYNGYDGYEVKYTYDALNLLTEKVSKGNENRATLEEIVSGKGSANTASNRETVTARYTYDVLQSYANVLTETVNGETTAYEYGLERIAAYTGTDAEQVKTQYVYDVRGSVIQTVTARAQRELSEATAAPAITVQGYAYTPYGEQIGSKISGYTYNGEYYDAATGMLNLRARQYEPAQMRFSQPDIVRGYAINPQSVNRYAYCVNNPVMYADPSGESISTVVSGIWNKIGQTTVGKMIDQYIIKPVEKTVNTISSTVERVAKNVVNSAFDRLYEYAISLPEEQYNVIADAEQAMRDPNLTALEKGKIAVAACSKLTYMQYWVQGSDYFTDDWWLNDNKVKTAVRMLELEAGTNGCVDLINITNEAGYYDQNFKLQLLQVLAGTMQGRHYDYEILRTSLSEKMIQGGARTEDYLYSDESINLKLSSGDVRTLLNVYGNAADHSIYAILVNGFGDPYESFMEMMQAIAMATILDRVKSQNTWTETSGNEFAGYYQDSTGRWRRPNGQFASNAEVGISSPANAASGSHGNSLNDTRTNYGYVLVDKDTNKILKFGETLYPDTRYSQRFLEQNNVAMKILESGSKRYIHEWQHDMNMYYKYKYGEFPDMNKGGW